MKSKTVIKKDKTRKSFLVKESFITETIIKNAPANKTTLGSEKKVLLKRLKEKYGGKGL